MSGTDEWVPSPCVRNCCLNDDEVCLGCFRSLDEIMEWGDLETSARKQVLLNADKRRDEYGKRNPGSRHRRE